MTGLLPIGTFATMTRLSVRMLRHYAERGLLRPARVDPASGYRYYRVEQAALAEIIRLLRAFDMPLDEIATAFDGVGTRALPELLTRHRARIEAEIAEKRRSLAYLDQLIAHVEQEGDFPAPDVELMEFEEQRILSRRAGRTLDDVGASTGRWIGMLFAAARDASVDPAGPPCALYHPPASGDGFDVEVCLPLTSDLDAAAPLAVRLLSGGTHAVLTHVGPYEALGAAYRALGRWCWEQGLEPSGPPREIYLTAPGPDRDPADYRTQLGWPVVAGGDRKRL